MAKCSECSAEMTSDAPEGICPACLLRRGLKSEERPTATVSRLEAIMFTDIADSSGYKARAGEAPYSRALRRHNTLFEQCIRDSAGGAVIKHTGDGFFAHFAAAADAVLCALAFQRALSAEAWSGEAIRVRIGIHIGEVEPLRMANRTDLVGSAVDESARIMSLGAGGQTLVSGDAADEARPLIKDDTIRWKRHGLYKLKGIALPIEIWQVAGAELGFLPAPTGAVDAAIPTEIGPYRILEQLGEGGMGTVYKAEQRRPVKRIVALKVIKPGLGSAEVIARFESERQALARMDHPNIAKVLDAGQTETGQPYFAMEYVPGVPLTKFADDKKLSLRQRLELFREVCAAIAHAHTKAIIHRDVKSSNVLAYLSDEKPFVKVIDFGIAKALTGDRLTDQTFNTDRGRAIGTFDSMSPEQAEGSPDIDTRTDVYSLGVLLYELLSGAPPFDRATLARAADLEIRRIIKEVEPPRPSTRLSSLGEAGTKIAASRREKLGALEHALRTELEWIPLMAMRKDRDRRYANPLEFSADIENYLQGRPLQAGPEKVSYRVRKFLHRNSGKVAAAAAIVLLLVGGIISTSLGMSWALRERAVAVTARQNETAAKEQAIASAGEARQAEVLAGQRALLMAQGQVSLGDALVKASRWGEAKTVYHKAYDSFVELRISPLRALAPALTANAASPTELLTLAGHTGNVRSVAFSPDGRTAVSGSEDKTLKLWDLATGTEIRTFRGHADGVNGVAFSPDGRTVLSGSSDTTLRLWDVATGTEIRTFAGHTKSVDSVAISPDGLTAVSASADQTVKVWDMATGKEIRTLSGHTDEVCSVVFDPDGRSVLSGSKDKTLKLWDLATGMVIRSFGDDLDIIFAVAITPDGKYAFAGGFFGHFMAFDLSTGKLIGDNDKFGSYITSMAITAGGPTGITGSDDNTLRFWDFTRGNFATVAVPGDNGRVSSVAFSPDGRLVLAGVADHTLRLFINPNAGNAEIQTLTGHTGPVKSVAISPDGRMAVSGSDDKLLKLWDLATGRELRSYAGHTDIVDSVAFSPDGRTILSGSEDNTLKLWDLPGGDAIRTFAGHTDSVRSVSFSPDGRTALSGGDDKTLRLWDLATGKEIRRFTGHTKGVNSVAFSPDGRNALSGSDDHTVKLWDLLAGGEIRTLTGHTEEVRAVAFLPDGRSALSGSNDKTLKLWDLATGKETRSLGDDLDIVFTAAVTPDGQSAVSGGFFAHFVVSDLETGEAIGRNDAHSSYIWSLAVGPDGRTAISASADKTLKVWDFSRAVRYWEFEPKVHQAQVTLQNKPDDADSLAVLGEWHAFRGVNDWAVEFLEKARAGGAEVSCLTLARCYWKLNKLPEGKREFQKALDAGEAPADYVNLCIDALGNAIPATQPN